MRIENRELRINTYFCNRLVPIPFQGVGLIGNQVRILNRPAAVNPQKKGYPLPKCHCPNRREGG